MFFGFLLEEVGFQRFQVTPKLSFGDGAWRANADVHRMKSKGTS